MKISLNWLKTYLDIEEAPTAIADKLTQGGLEVESIAEYTNTAVDLERLKVGRVTRWEPHPNADRLHVATVEMGSQEPLLIVCGADNVSVGCNVIVAPVGAQLLDQKGHVQLVIPMRIRGVLSQGVLCAEAEVGLPTTQEGVALLDTGLAIGSPMSQHFASYNDTILQVDITPNRSDASSHLGIARELGVLTHSAPLWPSVAKFQEPDSSNASLQVHIDCPDLCVRYSALVIKNVHVKASPAWLQNRLKSIGLTPQHNVADIVRFVLHETGQPVQALDYHTLQSGQLIVREAQAGSSFSTSCGAEKKTVGGELVVCDARDRIVSLAGVLTSAPFSVGIHTQHLLLESACFSAAAVRRNAKTHRLHTDASFRGERGTDPNISAYALKRTAMLIQEMAGGEVATCIVDLYPNHIKDTKVELHYDTVFKVLGADLSKGTIKQILSKLDIAVSYEEENRLLVSIPPYRVGVKRQIDLIAEIARIYGYDKIQPARRLSHTYLEHYPATGSLQNSTGALLAHNGYYELRTLPFVESTASHHIDIESTESVSISNPSSTSVARLRKTMLPAGLKAIAHNIHRGRKHMCLFEFGKVYSRDAAWYKEEQRLCLWLTGLVMSRHWQEHERAAALEDLYGTLYKILHCAGVTDFTVEASTACDAYAAHVQFKRAHTCIASAGVLRASVCSGFGIDQRVLFAEVFWEAVLQSTTGLRAVSPISKFPRVIRDLSLVIDKDVPFSSIQKVFSDNRSDVLQQMVLADVYEGPGLPPNKKSYTVRCTLQSQHHTLTETIIRRAVSKLSTAFERQVGALIRTSVEK